MLIDFIRASGRSQAHWAHQFGVSPPFLSEILNGKKRPGLDVAVRIERATGGQVPAASWVSQEAAE